LTASRAEKTFLIVSAVLLAAGAGLAVRTGEPLDLRQARFFWPAGLLSLTAVNVRLRSKVLAWALFALAFVLFMMVFGPWVLGLRTVATVETVKFMQAMALYLSLAVTALFQLRAARTNGGTNP
jgi:hypothetical protein